MENKSTNVENSTTAQTDANTVLAEVLSFLEGSKRKHYYCDDCWYTCPKHPEGCCNSEEPDRCNCGADEYNGQVDELVARARKHFG
jgi:hypothetical protein